MAARYLRGQSSQANKTGFLRILPAAAFYYKTQHLPLSFPKRRSSTCLKTSIHPDKQEKTREKVHQHKKCCGPGNATSFVVKSSRLGEVMVTPDLRGDRCREACLCCAGFARFCFVGRRLTCLIAPHLYGLRRHLSEASGGFSSPLGG